MSMTDPIADMAARLRNASVILEPYVEIPYSRFKENILKVLKEEKYVSDWELVDSDGKKYIRVHLLYINEKPRITSISKVSKPGRRVYVSLDDIKKMRHVSGIMVLSTPRGVISGKKAMEIGTGGELILTIG